MLFRSSNTGYPVPGGHLTSPDTQTNWNGSSTKFPVTLTYTSSARALLESLAYDCRSGEVDVRGDVREFIAREMSRHSALPYGRELTGEEMADIYTRLMTSGDRQKTPDGRKTIAIITDDSLDAMF